MSTYTLVREAREGRQHEGENVHCIEKQEDTTECDKYDSNEVRPVRNISIFTGEAPVCPKCKDSVPEFL